MTRPPTSADAVQGCEPKSVHEPETIQEACELLAALARDRLACVFVGGGTKLDLGAAPTRLDAVVRTGKLRAIVEYAPADQVITVEAGITLAVLQERLASERQRLSLDPPWPATSTIGGIVASNAFGPLRARSGGVRDLILGVSLVRADGVVAKGGGKVVKNVAGFDLPKLACGSLGTLGMIARCTLRVHPLPEASEARVARGLDAAAVPALAAALRTAQLEPAALLAVRAAEGGAWDVALLFEGFGAGVAEQLRRLGTIARCEDSGRDVFEAHRAARERATLRLKVAALPTALGSVEAALAPLSELVRASPGAELAWYPSLGLGFLSSALGEALDTAARDALVSAIAAARARLTPMRATLTVERAPRAFAGAVAAWQTPASLPLHKAVKARFDPEGLLAPGRFVGGI